MDIDIMKMDREIREERRNKLKEDRHYCVYVHTNKINGKMYVGMTGRKPEDRWRNGNGYVHCNAFYNAIEKYGWDNFEHDIIASNLTKEEAQQMEIALIKKLDLFVEHGHGYNIQAGGNTGFRGRVVYQFTLRGEYINQYESAYQAAIATGSDNGTIRDVCNHVYYQHNGFIWRWEREVQNLTEYSAYLGCIWFCEHPPIYQFDKQGNFIKMWHDALEIEENNKDKNWRARGILLVCDRVEKRNSAYGYIWRYATDCNWDPYGYKEVILKESKSNWKQKGKEVICFNSDGSFRKKYDFSEFAAQDIGGSQTCIISVCKRRYNTHKGFIFRYAKDLPENFCGNILEYEQNTKGV